MNIDRLRFRLIRKNGEITDEQEAVFAILASELPIIEKSLGRELTYLEEIVNMARVEWERDNHRKATDDELDLLYKHYEEMFARLHVDPISGDNFIVPQKVPQKVLDK